MGLKISLVDGYTLLTSWGSPIVLSAGIVAVLLNTILPQEDSLTRQYIEEHDPEGQDNGVDHGQEHESVEEHEKDEKRGGHDHGDVSVVPATA